ARNFDLICKVHTKKGSAGIHLREDDPWKHIWSDLCLDPIMGTKQIIGGILEAFEQDKTIGMIGSADLYRSAQHLSYGNEQQVAAIIRQIASSTDPCCDFGFFAGSMFWCRFSVLEPLLQIDTAKLIDTA